MTHPEFSSSSAIEETDPCGDSITQIPGTFQTERCFGAPLSLELCKPLSKGSVSLIPSSQSHADGGNFRIFFLDVFLGMQYLLIPPPVQSLLLTTGSVCPFTCDSINAR